MKNAPQFRVMLRIYADESELDAEKVRQQIRFDPSDPAIRSLHIDEDEEIVAVEFAIAGKRSPSGATEEEGLGDFGPVAAWFRARREDSFQQLREMGLTCDLFVEGHVGRIPVGLLDELVRLGVSLWIAPIA